MDSASSACFPQESQVFITGRLAARQPLGGRAEPQGRGSSDVRAAENAEEIGDAPDVHRHFFRGFPEVRACVDGGAGWAGAAPGPKCVGARYDGVVPGSQNTRDQVEAVFLTWRGRGPVAPVARPARPCDSTDGPPPAGDHGGAVAPLPGARPSVRALGPLA